MDHKAALLNKIGRLLSRELPVPEFRKEYYDFYLEQVPDEALSDRDAQFFGSVQEKLDWTNENPDLESQNYGWMNYEQYIKWVQDYQELYLGGKQI